ncbi:DUF421 domain-containing protein [Paenibacillaceae bacterium]|nr:DUF421 domain-containing protein [Paenibacillaceae bacterium]
METLQDILHVYGRIVSILPLLLLVALFMGKRSVGELPVFDYLVILSLGSIFGADIAEPEVDHIPTAAAIVFIGLLQRTVSYAAIRFRRFGKLISFEPTIVIHQGNLIKKNMKKINYSIDNILQMLREKDVFDIEEVETAIVEANGRLTIMKKPGSQTVTREDLKLEKDMPSFSLPVIIEGAVVPETLSFLRISSDWLEGQLHIRGVRQEELFFVSINEKHELLFAQTPPAASLYPIHH